MEQFRQIGEALGSISAYMAFQEDIRINRRQCLLLVEAFNMAFERIAEELRKNLKFSEKSTNWNALENPLRELHRVFKDGEQYVKQCLEPKDWWAKAISLNQSTDCVNLHLHNLLWCVAVVHEAVELAGEVTGCDQEAINKKRLALTRKCDRDWLDSQLFEYRYGNLYLASKGMCTRMDSVWKEDQWVLSEAIQESNKQENPLAEILLDPKGKIFPSSILVGSKDYMVRRRLGIGGNCKEIHWLGESFAAQHFFGDIEPFEDDINLLSSLRHPHVVHVMYAFFDEERKECFLVMELMTKDLSSYIKEMSSPKRRVPFPLQVAVDIMLQIARAMEYLHSHEIHHGDLNPSNILVKVRNASPDGHPHVKITGFRRCSPNANNTKASKCQATATNPCIWDAPEVLSEQEQCPESSVSRCTEKADVYSFSMICFELLTGKIPFGDDHLQGDRMSRNIRAGERPLFPFQLPKYLTSLMKRCWQADPCQRPNFSSICRVLRYIKRFLVLNPDHNTPDSATPIIDFFELEMILNKKFTNWALTEPPKVSEIPFQLFAYRIAERERSSLNLKEKSYESGSEGTSVCGDDNVSTLSFQDDSLPALLPCAKESLPPPPTSENAKKSTIRRNERCTKITI